MPPAWIDPLEPRLLLASNSIHLFARGIRLELAGREQFGTAVAADLNADGFADLVVGSGSLQSGAFNGGIEVFLNDRTGHFTSATRQATPFAPEEMVAADFNGDGKLDIALDYAHNGQVGLYAGDGQGGFASATQYVANPFQSNEPDSIVTGDFNGDGRPDVAVSGFRTIMTNPKTGVSLGESQIAVLLGTAAGFTAPVFTHIAGGYGLHLASVRYDGDNRTDLAVGGGSIQVLRSKGDGTFDFPTSLATGPFSRLMSRDLNGDGRPDLLWQASGDNALQYALAGPTGQFGGINVLNPRTSLPDHDGFGVGDFNGDGQLDLIVAPDGDSGRGTYFQRSGAFRAVIEDTGVTPMAVADFNGDGLDDMYGGGPFVFLANPPSAYTRPDGTLVITGTRRADSLSIAADGSRLTTVLNGVTYSSRQSKVARIQISTGLGSDRITIDPSVFTRTLISAGGDDDTVQAGSGNDTVQGDNGDDVLDGGAGVDLLQGGKGDDVLTGGAGVDSIYGNRGNDLYAQTDDPGELRDRGPGEGLFSR
jgi:Ca2+-binding RTX toxin-like protein